MKKDWYILIIFLVFSCKETNETKAQKSIKNYLFRELDDFDSYEPIEFGFLKPSKPFKVIEQEAAIENEIAIEQAYMGAYNAVAVADMDLNYETDSSALKKLLSERDSLNLNYSNSENLYSMTHHFRAKNKQGIVNKFEVVFLFDNELNVVETSELGN